MKMFTTLAISALLSSSAVLAAGADALAPTGRWTGYSAGRASTPPMGWNSWNAFASAVDEEKVMGSAQRIVDSGLARKGYRYINLDDGWAAKRRVSDGHLMIRADKFPSTLTRKSKTPSFKPYTDRLHAMGFKAGIYSDMGRNTCAQAWSATDADLPKGSVAEREVGLHDHIEQDIDLYFRGWGFDYIKVDGCGLRDFGPNSPKVKAGQARALAPIMDLGAISRTDVAAVQSLFRRVGAALERTRPDGDFVYSLCIWGAANVRAWAKDVGNTSRTSDDISPAWGRLLVNYDSAVHRALYAHPGLMERPGHAVYWRRRFRRGPSHRGAFALRVVVDAERPAAHRRGSAQDAGRTDGHPRQCRHHRARPGPRRQPGDRRLRLERSADP